MPRFRITWYNGVRPLPAIADPDVNPPLLREPYELDARDEDDAISHAISLDPELLGWPDAQVYPDEIEA